MNMHLYVDELQRPLVPTCLRHRHCAAVDPGDSWLLQIDGQRSMEAVFGDIAAALDDAKNKLTDPVEIFCADNPSELECKVFDE